MRKKNSQKLVIGVLFLLVFLLGFFQNLNISYAQEQSEEITLPQNFVLTEISEHNGTEEKVDLINIPLPSSNWNVSDIELEFTDMNFSRQNLTVAEWSAGGFPPLVDIKQTQAYAVQINISASTKIYGVQIYGRVYKGNPGDDVKIQIQGYDEPKNAPDGIINYSQPINMSVNQYMWWNQVFSTPIILTEGNYSLVLNVTNTVLNPAIYHWGYNNFNPKHPDLYISQYSGSWSNGIQDQPLLYKLDQEVIEDFNPEDFNMNAEINEIPRKIFNGTESGTGYLSLSNINFPAMSETLNIPIGINKPYTFDFNYSYNIRLKNNIYTDGSVTLNTNSKIQWNINFNLNRSDGNYSVEYMAPNSWENFTILKNKIKITGDNNVSIVGNSITIKNDIITSVDDIWLIMADSDNIPIAFSLPKYDFKAVEQFALDVLTLKTGNYTFVLYELGRRVYENRTTYINQGSLSFNYNIPPNALNGGWIAAIYWNNETDAGVKTESFTVSGGVTIISGGGDGGSGGGGSTTVTGLDPLLVLTISIIIIVAIAGSLTSYQTVKRLKRKRDLQMQKLRNKVLDSLNLNYIMISENASGLNVFEQFFGGKEIDPTLISGFLSAIRSFGIELTGTFEQSQTIKLEFQNSKILMNEFRHFRLILLMGENPSDDFIESLDNLAQDVEKTYGDLIRDFDGSLTKFTGIGKLIERHLNVSFLFPLKIISSKATKLTPAEKLVFNKAKQIIKQNNLDYIFTSFLMDDQTYEPKKIKAIFGLIEKGIFQPIRLENQSLKR